MKGKSDKLARFNIWLRRFNLQLLWGAGIIIVAAAILSHIPGAVSIGKVFYIVAFAISTELGITDYRAELLPEEKMDVIRSLQEQGKAL